ncbi:MAG: 4a-hydroxytetrahydrobiopterin dehydratase [Pseudomonadota bacterium]
MNPDNLAAERCQTLQGSQHRLNTEQQNQLLAQLPAWRIEEQQLLRQCRFADYPSVLLFVNSVAALAQRENHHPEISFGYNQASLRYSTHDVGGLSRNDFICAAKIEVLLSL